MMCYTRTVLPLVMVALSSASGFGLWSAQQQLGQLITMKNQLFNHFLYGPTTGNRDYSDNRVYTVNDNANNNNVLPNRRVKKRDVVLDIIESEGYPAEKHAVTTADGYRLKMHRIPSSNASSNAGSRGVAFVMHGIICSSADWINTGRDTGIGYTLADAGFDVWMGNARGNAYSKKHTRLATNSKEYWNFSWHEIGYYDLPAMIDYILTVTNQRKVHYIGHSQGTTSLFVLLSTRPEYNQKIASASMMAPVAFLESVPNPIFRLLAVNWRRIEFILNQAQIYELLQKSDLVKELGYQFCRDMAPLQEACAEFLFFVVGYSTNQLNRTLLPTILTHIPAGISTKQVYHFGQIITSGKFRQYDYDRRNMEIYQSIEPPDYNLFNIQVPMAFYFGTNDLLVSQGDFAKLERQLVNTKIIKKMTYYGFNHMDFLFGIDVRRQVYDDIVRTIGG